MKHPRVSRRKKIIQIRADGDCSHEIKRCLLLGRKVMTNLDSIFKSRDITLPTKCPIAKAMVFPVAVYWCESWTIKKLSAKELMLSNCGAWKTPETPLACNEIKPVNPRGNQSWIFIRRTDAPIFRPSDVKRCPSEKTLMLGKTEGRRKRGWQRDKMASLTQWTWVWASSKRWWRSGKAGRPQSTGSQRVGHDWAIKQHCVLMSKEFWFNK